MLTPIALAAVALWLLLPRGNARGRGLGMIVGAAAAGFGAAQLPSLGHWATDGLFWILTAIAVVAAVGAVTFRNPVYCALWFAMSLVGVSGLMLFAGAQFLAVATVAVYAGAIVVTFLFVLMLAQPEGRADYDRRSWEALISSVVGSVMIGILSIAIAGVFSKENTALPAIVPPTESSLSTGVLTPHHVAQFGEELWTRHLVAVESVGLLLFAALVGAAVVVGAGKVRMKNEE